MSSTTTSSSSSTPRHLPPNITPEAFAKFSQKVAEAVGKENFSIIEASFDFDGYHDEDFGRNCQTHDYYRGFDDEVELVGSSLCHPRSVQDVQAVLAACNEFKFPLWPVSTGRNLAYGGSAPRVRFLCSARRARG